MLDFLKSKDSDSIKKRVDKLHGLMMGSYNDYFRLQGDLEELKKRRISDLAAAAEEDRKPDPKIQKQLRDLEAEISDKYELAKEFHRAKRESVRSYKEAFAKEAEAKTAQLNKEIEDIAQQKEEIMKQVRVLDNLNDAKVDEIRDLTNKVNEIDFRRHYSASVMYRDWDSLVVNDPFFPGNPFEVRAKIDEHMKKVYPDGVETTWVDYGDILFLDDGSIKK